MATRIGDETRARVAAAWPEILADLASGALVRDCLKRAGLSADMLRAYKLENPRAKVEWDEAREQSADAFMDEALETASDRGIDPAHARVKVDTLKWAARIRNPRLYGDRAQLDVNVRTVDLTRIIQDANARLEAARGRVIEGAVIRHALEDLL